MDIVTDLTARTVSFLTVIQDICRNDLKSETALNQLTVDDVLTTFDAYKTCKKEICNRRKQRLEEIIWSSKAETTDISQGHDSDALKPDEILVAFCNISSNLLVWLNKQLSELTFRINGQDEQVSLDKGILNFTPYQWRGLIRTILFKRPNERIALTETLRYMPIQIILCLGGKKLSAFNQRLYQVWAPPENLNLLKDKDLKNHQTWWKTECTISTYQTTKSLPRFELVSDLLVNDSKILHHLLESENPVPFDTFFNHELSEINNSRKKRSKDALNRILWNYPDAELPEDSTQDPYERAKKMGLTGLAFSGGGIRSATFNLGVLQKLAEKNILPHIDYISTVSGGGYIGSWFTSWIKRAGSVAKVTDRLDVKKSADPLADEVKPIRWLRMYSNYLTPNVSIMSADSWTMGITWLRNTLINQLILLLLLCTGIAFLDVLFSAWKEMSALSHNYNTVNIAVWTAVILIPGSLLASFGMHMYNKEHPPQWFFNLGKNRLLSLFVMGWAIIAAYFVSTWLYTSPENGPDFDGKKKALAVMWFCGLAAMLIISHVGGYKKYAVRENDKKWINLLILGSSAIAATTGVLFLGVVWELFETIKNLPIESLPFQTDHYTLLFIIGLPLILEVISITVIVRMYMMGRLFPDERREWWGRMGAILHRFIIIWLLVTSCIMILPTALPTTILELKKIPEVSAVIGSWMALIGYAVKLAYNSTKSGTLENQKGFSIKEIFIRLAPYLFILGFLLLGISIYKTVENFTPVDHRDKLLPCAITTLLLAAITFILSWRTGVNEFSLHHFYRNRLVRAYLGATRRRTDRNKTANNFTGFDSADDLNLTEFTVAEKYYGPFPLINTALNATEVSELDRQDRKAEAFVFSPLYCGFDFSPTRSAAYSKNLVYDYGYRPTKNFAYQDGPQIGTAMAISGAAVNPNMGYHSSPATAFLLTVFNVRLGWWIGNPRLNRWKRSSPRAGIAYIMKDLFGKTNINSDYVCLSDGGHFDNMGLYELVRRRCSYIILGDAEEDSNSHCEGLANAIRRCRVDFGVEIILDPTPIVTKDEQTGYCAAHVSEGEIWYPGDIKPSGKLIYIKSALTGDESIDIREYQLLNLKFPQQSTGDQFFDEAQFESYRKLGYHSLEKVNLSIPC